MGQLPPGGGGHVALRPNMKYYILKSIRSSQWI